MEMVDDLDPTRTATTTIEFSLLGATYEIDLCDENAAKLRDLFSPWIAAARTVTKKRRTSSGSRDKEQLAAIRTWAQQNGYKVSTKGRIPVDVERAYHQRRNVVAETVQNGEKVETALAKVRAKRTTKAADSEPASVSA